MSDLTETMNTTNDTNEPEDVTSTKRAAVIKRQKEKLEEKKDVDELEEELGGIADLPDDEEEDSDQEYTTKKKKPIKKPDTVLDPAFQSRLVKKIESSFHYSCIVFRMKIKRNDLIIYLNKQKFFHTLFKMVN